ncbi:MAG: hypothetical protein PHE49_05625 [bacterium]|nr:hypothetical protein [bacterium]
MQRRITILLFIFCIGCDFGLNAPKEDANGIYLNLLSNTTLSIDGILRIDNNKAYIIGDYNLQVLDISDKVRPKSSDCYFVVGQEIKDAIINAPYFYIVSPDTLFIKNINSLSQIVGKLALNTTVENIKINGNYAYIKTSAGNLLIINISSPSNPELLGTVGFGKEIEDYIIEDKIGYLLFYNSLLVYDFSNPTHPLPIDISEITTYDGTGLKKNGEYLYRRGSFWGIYITKIKGQALESIRFLEFPREILDFDFDKYGIATDTSTLYLLNAQTPSYLCVIEKMLGRGYSLKTKGDYIYYLQNKSLIILKVEKLR